MKFFSMLRYKNMAEGGCLKSAKFDTLECNHLTLTGGGGIHAKHVDFMLGSVESIRLATGATISHANGVAGEAAADHASGVAYTMVADAISTFAGTGAAAALVSLPEAKRGTFCVLDITGDIDQTGVFTIQTFQATDLYGGKQHVSVNHSDNGGADGAPTFWGLQMPGTRAVGTAIELLYTGAAADTNHLGVGSEIFFYCNHDHHWLAKIYAVSEGVGSTGVWTASA